MLPTALLVSLTVSGSARAATITLTDCNEFDTAVYSAGHGDVIEVPPGLCGAVYFSPIVTVSTRITIRSTNGTPAGIPNIRITATPSGGEGVVLQDLELTANTNACTGSTACILDLYPGVQVDLLDVTLRPSSTTGILAAGTSSSPVLIRADGFTASGSVPLISGTHAQVALRRGSITGMQAAYLEGGSILLEEIVHNGTSDGVVSGGLLKGVDLDAVEIRELQSEGAKVTEDGGLIRLYRSPLILSDTTVRGCEAGGKGGLLFLEGDGSQTADLERVEVDGCSSGTGAALIAAQGYQLRIDRLSARSLSGAGEGSLIGFGSGSLSWVRGEVCGLSAGGGVGIAASDSPVSLQNLLLREVENLPELLTMSAGQRGLLAQTTVDLEGAYASALLRGGEIELFNNQLRLSGAGVGDATFIGRTGSNHFLSASLPADWSAAGGDFADPDPGWLDGELSTGCTGPGIPRLDSAHPAWDGGYTAEDWRDPDCSDSDIGVFGGPTVDLELATWFGSEDCADGEAGGDGGGDGLDGGDLVYGGGLRACGCGGGLPAGLGLLWTLPWLVRRRR